MNLLFCTSAPPIQAKILPGPRLAAFLLRKRKENKRDLLHSVGNDSNLLIVFYVQIMPDDFVMQLHRF
ncbi:hypothetical protein AA595_03685 [Klebsiella pneumoniae]|nr:hypothetical protein AA595_03685 [Klebsiella pneumoniae]